MAKIVTSTRRKRSSSRQIPSKVLLGAVVLLLGCFLLWYFSVNRNVNKNAFIEREENSIPTVKESQVNETTDSSTEKTNFALPQPIANNTPSTVTSNREDKSSPLENESVEADTSKTNLNNSPKVKHFPHKTEQLLALVLSTPPDGVMPPLPHLSPDDVTLNEDALLATTNALVVYEEDDAGLEGLKVDVADVKEQLADIVANDGNVADALNELRNYQNDGVNIRKKVIEKINTIEDDDEAAEFLTEVNKALEAQGISPIKPEEVGFSNFDKEEK